MHEYQKIKNKLAEILLPLGFSEDKSNNTVDDKGSMSCLFAKGDKKFLIQWDGEEGMGSVEAWEDGDWNMLENIVPEALEPKFSDCLNALCAELKTHL